MSDAEVEKAARNYGPAVAKLMAGRSGSNQKKGPRKARAKKILSETDRRHLRETGRTEQWNIRCRAGLKEQIGDIAKARSASMAALIEEVLEAFIASAAGDGGAT